MLHAACRYSSEPPLSCWLLCRRQDEDLDHLSTHVVRIGELGKEMGQELHLQVRGGDGRVGGKWWWWLVSWRRGLLVQGVRGSAWG